MSFNDIEKREDRNFKDKCKYLLMKINSLDKKKWKDLNTQLKNDWDKTINHLHKTLTPQQLDLLTTEINRIHEYLKSHPINKLGKRTKPPSGY